MRSNFNVAKELAEELRIRYAMFDKPSDGKKNTIIDSYAPHAIAKMTLNSQVRNITFSRATEYSLSELFCSTFGVREVNIKYILDYLGMSDRRLKQILLKVKRQHLTFVFAGFGGVGTNFFHWTNKLLEHSNTINLFKRAVVFDHDKVEFSNMIRIPFNTLLPINSRKTSQHAQSMKIKMFHNDYRISTLQPIKIRQKFVIDEYILKNMKLSSYRHVKSKRINVTRDEYANFDHTIKKQELEKENPELYILNCHQAGNNYNNENERTYDLRYVYIEKKELNNLIIFGAPDTEDRETMSKYNFISSTHQGNNANIWIRPMGFNDTITEGYGVIELTQFFINQIAATLKTLEFLASDDEKKWEPDKEIFNFSFKEYLVEREKDENFKPLKKFNFQLEHSGTVAERI